MPQWLLDDGEKKLDTEEKKARKLVDDLGGGMGDEPDLRF